jgi:NADH-quinone oxidoreductase subunit G
MPILFIDNKKIEANAGETIIEAAFRNGLYIPHFCWHPEMSIAGNCRMCLVEVGTPKRNKDGSIEMDSNNELVIAYMPKLQIACNTVVSEGMHVNTNTQKVVDARASVMEFILINHPLDCPICDEAGNCKLQKYSTNFGNYESRFSEEKNSNLKRQEWNDKIMYDAERCISCSRCIRFTRDIAKEDKLTFLNRGDKVRIHRFNDEKLQNNYSMNIIDTCPVGALTSRDFRFKARVWEMSFSNSICTSCSRGCNINVGAKNGEVLRVSPFPNMYVNKYWMCDEGRLLQPKIHNSNRLNQPQIRKNGVLQAAEWNEVITRITKILKQANQNDTYFLASPLASNESNFLFLSLINKLFKNSNNYGYIERIDSNFGDEFLKRNETSPNHFGLVALNISQVNQNDLIHKIKNGTIKNLIAIDENFEHCPDLFRPLANVENLILFTTNKNDASIYADVICAVPTSAEYEGTFTNCEQRVQHFVPAINSTNTAIKDADRFGIHQSRWDKFAEHNDNWNKKSAKNIKPTYWIINEILKHFGGSYNFKNASEIFNSIASAHKLFDGMNYELLDKHQGLLLGQANSPDPIINNYFSNSVL